MPRRLMISLLSFVAVLVLFQWVANGKNTGQAAPPQQAADTPPTPINVTAFSPEDFQIRFPPENTLLSPNGQLLALTNPVDICLFSFASQQTQCYPVPERITVISPVWSPDSRYLAFTEDTWAYIQESDLWLLDATSGEYINLTDDGITGSYIDPENQLLLLDYQPTWNPATGELYFFRTEFNTGQESKVGRTTLNRISVDGGEPEALLEVTEVLPFGYVYQMRPVRLPTFGGATRISPDGSQLAVLVRYPVMAQAEEIAGIWLIDLNTLAAPRHLVDYAALNQGLPPYALEHLGSLLPMGLEWAAGGQGLIEYSYDIQYASQPPAAMVYYIDVASGATTPIRDFSDVTDTDQFMPPERDRFRRPTPSPTPVPLEVHPDRLFEVPASVALSADGNILYMFNRGWSQWGVTAISLPPDGSAPVQIFTGQAGQESQSAIYSSAGQGRVLVGFLLLEVEE